MSHTPFPHISEVNSLPPKVLDIGVGSGYMLAVMAELVTDCKGCEPAAAELKRSSACEFFGIDTRPGLVYFARHNLKSFALDGTAVHTAWSDGRLKLVPGDGWDGLPGDAPFDIIHVGAAASEIPQALVEQLAPGGRMLIPVGDSWESQVCVKRSNELLRYGEKGGARHMGEMGVGEKDSVFLSLTAPILAIYMSLHRFWPYVSLHPFVTQYLTPPILPICRTPIFPLTYMCHRLFVFGPHFLFLVPATHGLSHTFTWSPPSD